MSLHTPSRWEPVVEFTDSVAGVAVSVLKLNVQPRPKWSVEILAYYEVPRNKIADQNKVRFACGRRIPVPVIGRGVVAIQRVSPSALNALLEQAHSYIENEAQGYEDSYQDRLAEEKKAAQ
jgi:hypothetical protein